MQQQWATPRSDYNVQWKVDFIWQPGITSPVVRLRRSAKALPKAKLAPIKRSRSLFNGLLQVWSTTAFWILAKPLHLRSMLSKSKDVLQHLHPALVNRKGPILQGQCLPSHCTTNASKVEWTGLQSFASFAWPFANWIPLLQASRQLFAGKMIPQPAGWRKCFSSVHQIPKHMFLSYRNKQICYSLAKVCWL